MDEPYLAAIGGEDVDIKRYAAGYKYAAEHERFWSTLGLPDLHSLMRIYVKTYIIGLNNSRDNSFSLGLADGIREVLLKRERVR